jgi:WD40 repeat protein
MDTTAPPSILLLDAPGLALSWYCPKVEDGVDDKSSWGGLFVGSGCDLLLVTWEGGGGDGGTIPTPTTKPIVTTEDDISALCAHPTKPILACCDDSGVITIIDAAKACVVRVLRKGGHTSLATSVVFLPLPVGSSLLLSGGCDHTLKLWDGVSPEGAKGPLLTVHANTLLAGAAGGGKGGGGADAQSLEDLSEEDLLDSLVKQNAVSAAAPSKESTYNPNPPFIHALSLLEGNLVAVVFGNGSVGVVSINTPPTSAGGGKARKRPTLTLHWHRREAYLSAACAVAALPGGYLLACGGKDSTIALWPWKEVVEGGEGGEPLRAWQHTGGRRKPRKVNWMAVEGGRGVLVVADTSSSLSLYTTTLGGV